MFAYVIELGVMNSLGRFKFSVSTFQRNWAISYAGELILFVMDGWYIICMNHEMCFELQCEGLILKDIGRMFIKENITFMENL